jgi:hypothetical protein
VLDGLLKAALHPHPRDPDYHGWQYWGCYYSLEATWSVPYDLINSECDSMEWSSSETIPTAFFHKDHSPKVSDLFIQWLYTRTYHEEDGYVEASGSPEKNQTLGDPTAVPSIAGTTLWIVKTAVMS